MECEQDGVQKKKKENNKNNNNKEQQIYGFGWMYKYKTLRMLLI